MAIPQTGIFALGNLSHSYLEFDLAASTDGLDLISTVANLTEPRTTMGGVNLVIGFRPELWAAAAGANCPAGVTSFLSPVVGPDGFTMPATQHDLVLWIAGGSYDVVFDASISVSAALRDVAVLARETVGWSYHRDLDLTGFIDGTENPSLSLAPGKVLIPPGSPGAGGSVLLLQKWAHDAAAWSGLSNAAQEVVIGRRKADSVELSDRPGTSHVARTDQDEFGTIFRRNTPYGSVLDHGTMFVGFSALQQPLIAMLASMAGATTGRRDALTIYTRPLTGAYYFVPAIDDLVAGDWLNGSPRGRPLLR
ncbi:MAG: porphyrinogen peroxidase [Actinomycetota bacterium]|jgi:putative iron-dependent peroxidase|nr:porphyrinogen peroxidase [Actinomycetota bacterium]